MTVTKAHIVERLFQRAYGKLTKTDCARIVETIFEIMKQSLENGEDVLISGFGKFAVRAKSPRRGRNPQTGEAMMLPGRRVVTFRCSSVLRNKMNAE